MPLTLPAPGEFTGNLSDVGGVCTATPEFGQVLTFSATAGGGVWCASTVQTGGGGGSLPNATSTGDILLADGAGFVYSASAPSDAGFVTVDHAQPLITFSEEGEIITYNGSELEATFPDSIFIRIKNNDTVALSNGDPVYVTTSGGSANTLLVARADASDPDKMPAVGVVAANGSIDIGGTGRIVSFGKADINATGMIPGDIVYVAVGGGLGNAPPTGATHLIQNIGVLSVSGANGKMKVTGVGRSNAVPNTITVGTGDSKTTIHVDGTSLGNTEPNSVVITDSSTSGYASGLSGVSGELVYFEGSPARPGTQSINQVLTNAGERVEDHDIEDLSNVIATEVVGGEVLTYNGTKWQGQRVAESDGFLSQNGVPNTFHTSGGDPLVRLDASSASASLTEAYTFTIPSGTLGDYKDVEIDYYGRHLNNAGTGGDLRMAFTMGGVGIFNSQTSQGTGTNPMRYHLNIKLASMTGNKYHVFLTFTQGSQGFSTSGQGNLGSMHREGVMHSEATLTSTVANDILFEIRHQNFATVTEKYFTIDSVRAKVLPNAPESE